MRCPRTTTTAVGGQGQAAEPVVVAAHRHHRRHGAEVVEHRGDAQVARVEDQVAAREGLEGPGGEGVDELADVGVGDHAHPGRRGGAQQR